MTKKKILIADPELAKLFKKSDSLYTIQTAKTGFECLAKLDTFQPDLVVVDLMLPQIHGIEILRKIKTDPRTHQIGVILTSAYAMIQNYRAAMLQSCDYFLEKPFDLSRLYTLFKLFFQNKLHPEPPRETHVAKAKQSYAPRLHSANSYIKFWGTRGSNPVSGPDYVRFGGNTCCLEIQSENDLVIVDAGTGIRPLGAEIAESKPKEIHLLLSHTHWDHLAGFPFFAPIYDPHCQVNIYSPIGFEKNTRELFTEMLAYAYFPVRLEDIKANLVFKDIHEGVPFHIGGIEIDTHYTFHPGATVCFKFKASGRTFSYATDNEFLMGYHGSPKAIGKNHPALAPYRSMIEFFKGADFLIHEAQFTPSEYLSKVGWGHSSVSNIAALIKHAEIRDWLITHHDPKHIDSEILKKTQLQYDVLEDLGLKCRSRIAFDGMTIPL